MKKSLAIALGLCFFIFYDSSVLAQVESTDKMTFSQISQVNRLKDVQPTDWAFEALRSLAERYEAIAGYADNTFRGNRAMTRYEFAAALNAVLNQIGDRVMNENALISEDLATLQRLEKDFATELATLRGRVDDLEMRTAKLENTQFATTTKLTGEALFAVNWGGFDGDSIVDTNGLELADDDPNPTLLYRSALFLDTSFTGSDQLRILLDTGSNGITDHATGVLEPNFGSVLDYSVKPPTSESFGLSRLFYTFKPDRDLSVSIGPNIRTTDYIDRNRYTKIGSRDFSTLALVNNYILFPIFGPSAGAEAEWNPNKGPFTIRALYAASDAANPGSEGASTGVTFFTNVLYPNPNASPPDSNAPPLAPVSDRGLFGDTYQGIIEVEYLPSQNFALRLQYSGGEIFDNRVDVFGVNAEFALSPKFAIFGRYGYGSYDNTAFGDIEPNYWMAGFAFPDLFVEGASAGIAASQPFIASELGNGTQTNFEAFYRYPLNKNIQVTPLIQVILDPANRNSNGTIVTGTLRTVFSF
ncbi:MAG: iron uptake porin [Xenococcaceae cyanobacterium]